MKRVTALFSLTTHRRLKLHALHTDATLISIISRAVEDYLDKHGTDRAFSGLDKHGTDRAFDLWIEGFTLHVHCGIVVLELSWNVRSGPPKASTHGHKSKFYAPSMGTTKNPAS
jgi:hypothetical protein